MSFTKQPAFVHTGSWDEKTRAHPAMKWMEDYTKNSIDTKSWDRGRSSEEDHIPEMLLQRADGHIFEGRDEMWKGVAAIYAPFAAHKHDPTNLVCWETEDGWAMNGVANLYFNLHGVGGGAVKDPQGEKWDGVGPAAFTFQYKKVGNDIKLKETRIYSDPSPALKLMLQNKQLNGEQIAGLILSS